MSERTVADDTLTPGTLATWADPTGVAVPTYSVTTASKMAARRGSSSPETLDSGAFWGEDLTGMAGT